MDCKDNAGNVTKIYSKLTIVIENWLVCFEIFLYMSEHQVVNTFMIEQILPLAKLNDIDFYNKSHPVIKQFETLTDPFIK